MATENTGSTPALSANDAISAMLLELPPETVFDEDDLGAFARDESSRLPQLKVLSRIHKGQCGDMSDGIEKLLFFNALLVQVDTGYRVGGANLRVAQRKMLEEVGVMPFFQPTATLMAQRFLSLIRNRRHARSEG